MRTKILALAALMAAGLSATPALADYVRLGSVDVGYRTDRDTTWSRFGGGMEGLQLTADRSNIFCRNIRVTFRNGDRENVFSGMLREDRPVDVDLRGGVRRVERIDFTCRSDEFRGGRIYINADVGRYRDEWRRDPMWTSLWAALFGGDRGGYYDRTHDDWTSLGRVRFEGRRDRENAFAGWRGRSVDRIALRAIDGDARCRRITAEFASGRSRELSGGDYLQRGRATVLDLPGGDRNLSSLNMRCRAVGDYDVTVEVLVRR
jgi:hypothetical protein